MHAILNHQGQNGGSPLEKRSSYVGTSTCERIIVLFYLNFRKKN